jgi:hypothetical protein
MLASRIVLGSLGVLTVMAVVMLMALAARLAGFVAAERTGRIIAALGLAIPCGTVALGLIAFVPFVTKIRAYDNSPTTRAIENACKPQTSSTSSEPCIGNSRRSQHGLRLVQRNLGLVALTRVNTGFSGRSGVSPRPF